MLHARGIAQAIDDDIFDNADFVIRKDGKRADLNSGTLRYRKSNDCVLSGLRGASSLRSSGRSPESATGMCKVPWTNREPQARRPDLRAAAKSALCIKGGFTDSVFFAVTKFLLTNLSRL